MNRLLQSKEKSQLFRQNAVRHHSGSAAWKASFQRARRTWARIKSTPKTPIILGSSALDCGAACLAMILGRYGKRVSVQELRNKMEIQRDGVTAATLMEVAAMFGLIGKGVSADLQSLEDLALPAILHWDFNHFVVLARWRNGRGDIIDPSFGRRPTSNKDLDRHFTGVVLIFELAADFKPSGLSPRRWRRLLSPILNAKRAIAKAFGLSLVLKLLGLALPILTAVLVDAVVGKEGWNILKMVFAMLPVLILVQMMADLARGYLLADLRICLDEEMMVRFLRHVLYLPYSFFHSRSTSDLLIRLASNATIRETFSHQLFSMILDCLLLLAYLALMFIYQPTLTGLVLIIAATQIGFTVWHSASIRDSAHEEIQAHAKSQRYLLEILRGIDVVKTAAAEERVFHHWNDLFISQLSSSRNRDRRTSLLNTLLSSIGSAAPLILLSVGTALVMRGELSLGRMLAFNALAIAFLSPLWSFMKDIQMLQLINTHLDRIDDVLALPTEQPSGIDRVQPNPAGRLVVDRLSFRYSKTGIEVLKNISFEVEPGSMLAIVGATGSGKSTLARLLLGLYQPSSGRVLYDGRQLIELDLPKYRAGFGAVLQGSVLFNASITDNIAFGQPNMRFGDVEKAARLAEIAEDILAMPMGFDTPLAELGRNLSGGQRQRLCIARALAHEPSIVILDEATSELDLETENRIHRNLSKLSCTRIIITHRLNAIQDADLIIVMNDGHVVGRGTHVDLALNCELYSRLLGKQAGRV
jgi:ABC-type bacteriocin/lantibiotic exporter with double-glycine peptidase domain